MQGCKYNYIVQSVVPENMIEPLNKIYQASELTVKVNDRQWFHVFNREHCLTLKELLEFRKTKIIEFQDGQIALLMMKFIEKFISIMSHKVVHGNLTFDNVWIINTAGFWPHNQQHNYEIVFVNYQGDHSDNLAMQKLLLALNDIVRPKEKQRILDLFVVQNEDQLHAKFLNFYKDLDGKVDKNTQKLTGWFQEGGIYNKFKQFADPNVFQALLPLNDPSIKTKLEKSLSYQHLDESRNIIIEQMLSTGQDTSKSDEVTKIIENQIKNDIKSRVGHKKDLIQYFTSIAQIKIQDFIDQSMIEFEQSYKFKCNQTIKQKQPEYIENFLKSISDNYFEFNSDLAKQIEIVQPILEKELLKTQKQIINDLKKLFIEEAEGLINSLQ